MNRSELTYYRGRRFIRRPDPDFVKPGTGGGGVGFELQFNDATFRAPFSDAGSGAVRTTLDKGSGVATFTRATAAAARLSNGLWNLGVASGVARSHYLADGTYGGYLAENAATQILTSPRDMTNAAWVGVTMTAAQTATGLEGAANSCTLLTAAGANSTILQTITAAASTRTYSAYVQRSVGTGIVEITQDGATWTDITSQLTTTGFTLVQLTASILNAQIGFRIQTSGDAIIVDCNQFEAGSYASTPIPAAGTRNADVLSYTIANVSNTSGTMYAEVNCHTSDATTDKVIATPDTGTTRFLYNVTNTTSIAMNDGTNTTTGTVGSITTAIRKVASAWSGTTTHITGSGNTATAGTYDGAFGATALGIGNASGGALAYCGTIKNLVIWTRRLTAAQLAAITVE